MKNFLLRFERADGSTHFCLLREKTFDSYFFELMVLRTISASWARENVWFLFFWHDIRRVEENELFFSPIRANFWLLDSIRPPEPKNVDSYFLHKVYVECMKNFLLADSSELMVLRLISASWARENVWFLLFWHDFLLADTSSWRKIFFSPIRTSWWLLDSFRPPEPKNLWFLLFWHDVRRVDEKFSSHRFERADGC